MPELADNGVRTSIARRLDYLPAWAAMVLGVAVGGVAGVLAIGAHPVAGGVVFVVLVALAGGLAWSGEPVAVFEGISDDVEPEPPEPTEPYVIRPGWVAIPGGAFRMGSPEKEEGRYASEGPVHEVRLSPFEMMQHPVTRRLYVEIMGKDPGWPKGEADRRPVNKVNWFDAVELCNRRSENDGFDPCYRIRGKEVAWDRSAAGYRLPTEAEWECACRAGTASRWSFGDDQAELDRHAWYNRNSDNRPHPVGEKEPNPWGLHDMHGNVREWCWDWYGSYPEDPQQDPTGQVRRSSGRVLRGGSFFYSPRSLRSAFRDWYRPEFRDWGIGFRCVRSPRRQP